MALPASTFQFTLLAKHFQAYLIPSMYVKFLRNTRQSDKYSIQCETVMHQCEKNFNLTKTINI